MVAQEEIDAFYKRRELVGQIEKSLPALIDSLRNEDIDIFQRQENFEKCF